jgi:transcriptional regulator with XRE-family HTH domain
MEISGAQIRAARALLGWNAALLAERSGVSPATVQRTEAGSGSRPVKAVRDAIVAALEREGVEFIDGGARLKPEAAK